MSDQTDSPHQSPQDELPNRVMDADIEDAKEPSIAHFAGGAQAIAGLLGVLAAAQQIGTIHWRGALAVMPWVELVLGVVCITLAFRTYRARRRGSLAAAIAALMTVPIVGGWTAFAATQGFLTCLGLFAPLAGGLGAGLGFAALSAIRRTSDARERLADQGMDFGI
ncbi:MAG: hypothetical protein GXP55_14075 [Deltaproteobacteria bacterium]|nr:hypothetical protein [Deltaproteobacteria bacterium]